VFRYLSTIDIALDHFGFSLSWGPAAWLPMIYTIQAQYLAIYPVHISWVTFGALIIAGVAGYVLFRVSNYEKHMLRGNESNPTISQPEQRVIHARYKTATGDIHKTRILCSGTNSPFLLTGTANKDELRML
jgi:7-dehydrocholesterol reductase